MEYLQIIGLIAAFVVIPAVLYFKKGLDNVDHYKFVEQNGKCPECKSSDIHMDRRGGGCSGTQIIDFKCNDCGQEYHWVFPGSSSCSR